MLLSELQDKEILIVGFGREGQDSFLFLRKHFPQKNIGIADQKEFEELPLETQRLLHRDRKAVLYFGPDYKTQVNKYDVVLKSPGIPLRVLEPLLKKEQTLTSSTNIFLANCPSQVIGITGTKGKSTTAALLAEVLKAERYKAYLVGNIETPPLQFLDGAREKDVFVYELSSFQLETAQHSPAIAVFLNLYPEHLDHHGDFKTYEAAKANITKFQTPEDFLIFNEADKRVRRLSEKSEAKKIPFTPKTQRDVPFAASLEPVFLVAKLFGIPKENVQKILKKFKPLPHRFQLVGTKKGITFYSDSLATIPEATIAALDILDPNVSTLIVGGHDRGIAQTQLAQRILDSKIRNLVLLPVTGEIVWNELEALHRKNSNTELPNAFPAQSMEDAVKTCYEHTPKNKICLLSPAASSFNQFRNYKERGEEFIKWVTYYGKKART